MRLYPVWNIVHDDQNDALLDELLASRGLTLSLRHISEPTRLGMMA